MRRRSAVGGHGVNRRLPTFDSDIAKFRQFGLKGNATAALSQCRPGPVPVTRIFCPTRSAKNGATDSRPYFCQILTDLRKIFTGRFLW